VIPFLAQSVTPDFTAIAIQAGVGGIAVFMLKWFMGKNDAALRSLADSFDRMGQKIAASNDRMGRAHLMLVIALDGVNEAAKARARELLGEIDEALKQHEKEQVSREPRP
jgi:hypothetical protein